MLRRRDRLAGEGSCGGLKLILTIFASPCDYRYGAFLCNPACIISRL